jgi:molybdopterin synthase sulfur carrier subunit
VSAVTVRAAPLLHRYTRGAAVIRGRGETLAELLDDLDHRFPGIRFRLIDEQDRMRPHVRFFVNRTHTRDCGTRLRDGDEIYIVGALSGG